MLIAGYETTVFVRNTGKLPVELEEKCEIVVGDVLNPAVVQTAVQGKDAVVVALGTRNDLSE